MTTRSLQARWTVSRLADVAQFFGVSAATVKNDWRANNMPGKPGAWNLAEIVAWRESRREDSLPSEVRERTARAELVLLESKAEQARLDLAERMGEIVQREEVLNDAAEVFSIISARLEAIPDETEMEIPFELRTSVKQTIANKIYLALKYLGDWQPVPDAATEADDAAQAT